MNTEATGADTDNKIHLSISQREFSAWFQLRFLAGSSHWFLFDFPPTPCGGGLATGKGLQIRADTDYSRC